MCGDCEAQSRTGTGTHGETSGSERCSCWYEGRSAAQAELATLRERRDSAVQEARTAAEGARHWMRQSDALRKAAQDAEEALAAVLDGMSSAGEGYTLRLIRQVQDALAALREALGKTEGGSE